MLSRPIYGVIASIEGPSVGLASDITYTIHAMMESGIVTLTAQVPSWPRPASPGFALAMPPGTIVPGVIVGSQLTWLFAERDATGPCPAARPANAREILEALASGGEGLPDDGGETTEDDAPGGGGAIESPLGGLNDQ